MSTHPDLMGRAALRYAELGLPVFPCHERGKTPLTQHGLKDASRDPEAIRRWWEQTPQANIGLPTGAASGLFALDVDGPEGEEALARLIEANGPLPDTWEQQTGRGRHVLFAYPKNGAAIRNSAGKLGTGLDIRGEGGYVIVPLSVHPDGHLYKWQENHTPSGCKIAEAPEWFLSLVKYKAPPSPEPRTKWRGNGSAASTRYAEVALERESEAVASAPEGQRNDALNRASHSLGQLVGSGALDRETAELELTRAALHAGLHQIEVQRTIKSGLVAGEAKPREVPQRNTPSLPRLAAADNSENGIDGNKSHAPCLRAVTIHEFLKTELPPRENVLAPWLPTQGLTMIYAKRGIGKTHMGLGIAYAVASGGKFLKWEAPKPRPVLYLDGEMPAVALQERIAAIVKASAIEPPSPEHLKLITPDLQERGTPDIGCVEGQEAIEEHLEGVKLVILDNLSTLLRQGRENEAESWNPVQEWALSLRRKGVSVLFIHHAGKGGQQRGTSRREDVLDTVIKLKHPSDYAPPDGCRVEVHFDKARGIQGDELRPFEAKLEYRDGEALWTTRDLEECLTGQVAELSNLGITQRDIAKELDIGLGSVNRHLQKARETGLITT